ncbi:SPOSA6832_01699, partial [Sporobolomyces salmonicolor]
MDVDKDDVQGSSDAGEREPWESTRAGKRIAELNAVEEDIQFGLRTSIRHLRVSRTSPAPLLDPSFGSLATSGGPQPSQVGVGGAALAELLKPLELSAPTWDGKIGRSSEPEQGKDEQRTGKLSVAAKELEREAWKELADALEGGRRD